MNSRMPWRRRNERSTRQGPSQRSTWAGGGSRIGSSFRTFSGYHVVREHFQVSIGGCARSAGSRGARNERPGMEVSAPTPRSPIPRHVAAATGTPPTGNICRRETQEMAAARSDYLIVADLAVSVKRSLRASGSLSHHLQPVAGRVGGELGCVHGLQDRRGRP